MTMTQVHDDGPDACPTRELIVPEALEGQRLDRVVATLHADLSRTEARRLIDLERVTVEGESAYLTGGYRGLHIIDVEEPTNPTEVGWYFTLGIVDDCCKL
jgi:hypothetical protein